MTRKLSLFIAAIYIIAAFSFFGGFLRTVEAAQTRLGGMNLSGYCSSQNQGSANLTNGNWTCSNGSAIVMNTACVWQYPNQNASAVQETVGNPYSWACYSNSTPTWTPTPSAVPTNALSPTPTKTPTGTPVPSLTPSPTQAPTSSVSVYDDGYASGWKDASYNATSAQSSTQVYSKSFSLAATINADGGLDFQSVNGQSTNNYTTFHFALRSSSSNERFEVYADSVYGQPLTAPVSLANYGGQPTSSGWTVYDIPLSALGATNITLKDVVLHDMTGSNQPALYVDQVELRGTTQVSPTPTPTKAPSPTPTSTPTPTPVQGNTYMALGDSFAFGFHLALFQQQQQTNSYNPASYNDGYDADFFQAIKNKGIVTAEVNYACPGETAGSMINGGCSGHSASLPLHTNYPVSQSQLQAAVAYLQANPGKVATITLDIGVNEAINLATTCQASSNPSACYNNNTSGVLATLKQNYDTILNALSQAAPSARIILVKAPDPVFYDGSDNLVNGINQIIDNQVSSRGLRSADTYSLFTASNVCSLTNYCVTPQDFHPNASGYSAMSTQILQVSGY